MWMERTLGDLEPVIDKLNELVPLEGSVESPRSANKYLERFRKAQNAVYDCFNNGLMNQRKEFASIFGMRYAEVPVPTIRSQMAFNARINWEYVEDTIAPEFRRIIGLAAAEQFGIHYRSNMIIAKAMEEEAA
tara:strand:+ start:523 stop:921 length:399 start_codon:yes stop_codon:yes gene_type:complete